MPIPIPMELATIVMCRTVSTESIGVGQWKHTINPKRKNTVLN